MKKCTKCPICPFVKPAKRVKSTSNNTSVNCQSQNIIYCISCQNCRMQYIGESERSLQHRFSEHKGYAKNKHLAKATGAHFNLPGHSASDMKVTILEKVHSMDPLVRKEREELFIRKFKILKYKGMNCIYFLKMNHQWNFFLVLKLQYIIRFSEKLTQSDDELIISSKYITDRALDFLSAVGFFLSPQSTLM